MELVKINPDKFGLKEENTTELTKGLKIPLQERELLIQEFNNLSTQEITKDNRKLFRELRLKVVKNRTQGIDKWHKGAKNYFLKGGQFVDAIKKQESLVNEQMEAKLLSGEKYFENLEKERLAKLHLERYEKIKIYLSPGDNKDLSEMSEDMFKAFFNVKKENYEIQQAELKRIEDDRIAKEKALVIERERIKLENERLKAEAIAKELELKKQREIEAEKKKKEDALRKIELEKVAKEKAELEAKVKKQQKEEEERIAKIKEDAKIKAAALAKIEADNKIKIQAEYKAKIKAEKDAKEKLEEQLKAQKDAEAKRIEDKLKKEAETQKQIELQRQLELAKGDSEKIKNLINDFIKLQTKYSFTSSKYQLIYKGVINLINKIITYINQ